MPVDPLALSLVLHPSSVLRQRAETVDVEDPLVNEVARRMIEIMYQYNGAGLAAPQVGLAWRLFVTRPSQQVIDEHEHSRSNKHTPKTDTTPIPPNTEGENEGVVWINPSLEVVGDQYDIDEEGCLSLPEIRGRIRRSVEVKISGYDIKGTFAEMTSDQFIARVWQHEIDHLDGILIIDKMSAMDRLVCRRQIRELERAT